MVDAASFFSLSLVLALAGLGLLGLHAARDDKGPFLVLAGAGLLAAAVFARLLSGGPPLGVALGLLVDVGAGLLFASLLLAAKRSGPRPFFLLGVLVLVMAALLYGFIAAVGHLKGGAEGALLLELGPDDHIEEVAPLLARYHARAERAFPEVTLSDDADLSQVYVVHGLLRHLERLARALLLDEENVDHVEMNGIVRLPPLAEVSVRDALPTSGLADDPLAGAQWGLAASHIDEAHRMLRDLTPRKRAIVAILDTGVDARHEDLGTVFKDSPGAGDVHGHGTHCAGIAGAVANNGIGMASLNWEGRFVQVAAYRALPNAGQGTYETIAQAVIDATRDGADVLSLSLGNYTDTQPKVIADAIAYALRKGAVVVASAGNAGEDARDHTPSNVEGVIAVAALDRDLSRASFSNTTAALSRPLAAPGVDILSLKPDGAYTYMSGTSMAAPFVAGLAGVLRAVRPGLSPADVYALLHETGRDVSETPSVGRLVDAEAAVRRALEGRD